MIKLATNPGDLVLDPFMGVGSTGVAALQLSSSFTGMEIDPLYFKAAEKRIEAVTPELFTPESENQDDITGRDNFIEEPLSVEDKL